MHNIWLFLRTMVALWIYMLKNICVCLFYLQKCYKEINKNTLTNGYLSEEKEQSRREKNWSLTSPNTFWCIFYLFNHIFNIQNVKLKHSLKTLRTN